MEQSLQTHVRNSSIALKKCHVIDVRFFNEIKCFLKDKNRIHAVNIYVHPTMQRVLKYKISGADIVGSHKFKFDFEVLYAALGIFNKNDKYMQ